MQQSQSKKQIPENKNTNSQIKRIREPKKYLKQNSYTQELLNTQITYFIAEKQNNSGILSNQRFFMIWGDQYFGYASSFNQNTGIPFSSISAVPALKTKILLQQIKQVLPKTNSNILSLKFKKLIKDKEQQYKWNIKFNKTNMLDKVCSKLDEAITKRTSFLDMKSKVKQTISFENTSELPPDDDYEYKFLSDKAIPVKSTIKKQDMIIIQNNQQSSSSQNSPHKKNEQLIQKSQRKQKSQKNEISQKIQGKEVHSIEQHFQNHPINNQNQNITQTAENVFQRQKDMFKKRQENLIQMTQYIQKKEISNVPVQLIKSEINEEQRTLKLISENKQNILKNQIKDWNFQFWKGGGEEHISVSEFKKYSEILVTKIIDELALEQSNRIFVPTQTTDQILIYQINDIYIRLCFTALKDVKLLQLSKQIVYDQGFIKDAYNQLRNMNYILQMTRNQGKIRIPLAMIVEYKGVVAFVKAITQSTTKTNAKIDNNDLKIISESTRIHKSIFQKKSHVQIKYLTTKLTQKINRSLVNNVHKSQTPICYLDEVKNFLPQDLLNNQKNPENKFLRPEFIQKQLYNDKMFLGDNLLPYIGKVKVQKNIQDGINQLLQTENDILNIIDELLSEWQNLDQIVLNSKQFIQLFHRNGINLRYIGIVYQNTKSSLIKSLCMSEIVARCIKIILRANIQEQLKNPTNSISTKFNDQKINLIHRQTQNLLQMTIQYLNSILGQNKDTSSIWKTLNKQALYSFNTSIQKQQIQPGYFIQAVFYHCNLEIVWDKFERNFNIFRQKYALPRDIFKGFGIKSKIYDLSFSDLYLRVDSILNQQNEENLQQLKSILNLRKFNIPEHFNFNSYYERIALYLVAYIPPKKSSDLHSLPCSNIYEMSNINPPNMFSINLSIFEIKWNLKQRNKEGALKIFKRELEKITIWYGDFHPILNLFYSLFAQYFLEQKLYQQAISYSKSGLGNYLKLIGSNCIKTSEAYFQLAQIYTKYNKKQQALSTFKKSKAIFENTGKIEIEGYGQINFKLGQISLSLGKLEQSKQFILKAINFYENEKIHQKQYQTQKINCYEILSRIYQINSQSQQYLKLSDYCYLILKQVQSNQNLQKILKIILYPSIASMTYQDASNLVNLIQNISVEQNPNVYANAQSFLRTFINKNNFKEKVKNYFTNFNEMYQFIAKNNLLARWNGLQTEIKTIGHEFLVFIQCLVYFVGEGFVIGALKS